MRLMQFIFAFIDLKYICQFVKIYCVLIVNFRIVLFFIANCRYKLNKLKYLQYNLSLKLYKFKNDINMQQFLRETYIILFK